MPFRHPFHLFSSFQTNITILQQINVKNVHPVYGARIRTHDLWNMSLVPLPLDIGLPLRYWPKLRSKSDLWYQAQVLGNFFFLNESFQSSGHSEFIPASLKALRCFRQVNLATSVRILFQEFQFLKNRFSSSCRSLL